jgi:hypothetical protein
MSASTTTEGTPPYALNDRVAKQAFDRVRIAHALLYGLAVLAFSAAAVMLRLFKFKHIIRVHYILQLLATALMLAGFACGAWLAVYPNVRHRLV